MAFVIGVRFWVARSALSNNGLVPVDGSFGGHMGPWAWLGCWIAAYSGGDHLF